MTDLQLDQISPESIERLLDEGSFEETLQTLGLVVERLERGRISLDEAVNWYEIGLALSRRCATLLEQAELRISTLETAYSGIGGDKALWDDDDS